MIEINNLVVEAEEAREKIIDGISFSVPKGGSNSVIGPSGCGKTTLLHALVDLRPISSGSVRVNHGHGGIALILQDIGLLPWKTVWQNAKLGVDLANEERNEVVLSYLKELGIAELKNRYPKQLSGGQKRRLGLARALAMEPDVLLMDEPLVSLDELTREKLQNTILNLWKSYDLTMIMVTHDIEEAVFLGQRIEVLTERPATIKDTIDNDKMGEIEFRRSDDFYQVVKKLREVIS